MLRSVFQKCIDAGINILKHLCFHKLNIDDIVDRAT